MSNKVFRYGPGGALVCDHEIEGITQGVDEEAAKYYGGAYFIGESMAKSAARKIAELLGGELDEPT